MVTLQYVQPTDEQKAKMQEYRDLYTSLYEAVKLLPDSRGKSIALTKLEESAMWVNKGITDNS